jgi:hypothetical protein
LSSGEGRFHESLDCNRCHPEGRPIGKLDRRCDGCHHDWQLGSFDHAVTGLRLDEEHAELDCSDCHLERRFERQPRCDDCHDDDRKPSTATPGEYLD